MMTNLDILVLLVVVVLIFQRLRSLLGTRPAEEKHIRLSRESAEKLYHILKTESEKQEALNSAAEPEEITPVEEEPLTEPDKTLRRIPNFEKERFINSAERVFRITTDAFNNGDAETLEMLLSPKLFKKFQEIIDQRRNDGVSAETDFICFDKVEITKAEITDNQTAKISVEFVSQQVNILRDKDGNVIEGDENYIQNITDVWTFERALNSASPNWILISTKK
ncbi:MAG: Tim44 domain-containing protein [Alphaproteobacteria bacterium]|nr:Tim44 domain-containing protein [Alphaproteobacteria bacterium]